MTVYRKFSRLYSRIKTTFYLVSVECNGRPSYPLHCYVLLDCECEENQQTYRRKGEIYDVISVLLLVNFDWAKSIIIWSQRGVVDRYF